jgi:hypothetical protein
MVENVALKGKFSSMFHTEIQQKEKHEKLLVALIKKTGVIFQERLLSFRTTHKTSYKTTIPSTKAGQI